MYKVIRYYLKTFILCCRASGCGGNMRIVICEDNSVEQENLANNIKDWSDIKKIDVDLLCFNNAEEFLFAWPDIVVDIIFLDIKMKGISGIKLADKIKKISKNILIIFITNFPQYSLKGYDVDALHFLVKPVSSVKLNSVLDKAYGIWSSHEKDAIVVTPQNDCGQIKLFCGDIYFIKMNSHKAELHTENQIFEIRKTVEELIKLLPPHFVRCHRSHIVNLLKAECVYKNYILLSTGEKLPVSRNQSKYVKDTFVRLFKE